MFNYLPESLYKLRLRRLALFISEHWFRDTPEADTFLKHFPVCSECGQRKLPTLLNWFLHWDCREWNKVDRKIAGPNWEQDLDDFLGRAA